MRPVSDIRMSGYASHPQRSPRQAAAQEEGGP